MSQRGTRAAKTAAAGFAKRVLSGDIYSLVIPPSSKPVTKKQTAKVVESSKPARTGTDSKAGSASPRSRSPRAESPRLRTSRSKSPAADEGNVGTSKDVKRVSNATAKSGAKNKKESSRTNLQNEGAESCKRNAGNKKTVGKKEDSSNDNGRKGIDAGKKIIATRKGSSSSEITKKEVASISKKVPPPCNSTSKKGTVEVSKKTAVAGSKKMLSVGAKKIESDDTKKEAVVSKDKSMPDIRGTRSRAGSEAKLDVCDSKSTTKSAATEEVAFCHGTPPRFFARRGRPRKGEHVPREPPVLEDMSKCDRTDTCDGDNNAPCEPPVLEDMSMYSRTKTNMSNNKTKVISVASENLEESDQAGASDVKPTKESSSAAPESSTNKPDNPPSPSVSTPTKSPVPKVTFITVDGKRIPVNCKFLETVQSTSSIVNQILVSAGVMSPKTSPAKGGSPPKLSPQTSSPPAKANVYKLMLNSKNQAALSTIDPKQLIDSLSKSDKDKIFTVKILPSSSAENAGKTAESLKSLSGIHRSPVTKVVSRSPTSSTEARLKPATVSLSRLPATKEKPSIIPSNKKTWLLDEKSRNKNKEDVSPLSVKTVEAQKTPVDVKEESPEAMECDDTNKTETPVKIKIECPSPVETIESVTEGPSKADWFLSPVKHPTELITKNKFFQIFGLYDKAKVEAEKGKSKMHRAAGGKLRRTIKSRLCPEMVYGNFLVTKTGILEGIPDSWSSGDDTDGEIDPAKLAKQLHLLDPEQTQKLGLSRKVSLLSVARPHSAPTTPERRSLLGETSTLTGLKENEPPYLAKRKISFGPKTPKKEWLKPKILKKSPELLQITKNLDKKKSSQRDSDDRATKSSKDSSNKNGSSKSKKQSDAVRTLQVKSKSFDGGKPSATKSKLEKSKSFGSRPSVIREEASKTRLEKSKSLSSRPPVIKEEPIDDPNARRSARQKGKRKEWWHLLRANPDEFEVDKKWEEEIEETEKRKSAREEKRRRIDMEDEDSLSSVMTEVSSKDDDDRLSIPEKKDKDRENKSKKKSDKEKNSSKKDPSDTKKKKPLKRKADDENEGVNSKKPKIKEESVCKLDDDQASLPKKKKKKKKKKTPKDDSESPDITKYQFHENGAILTKDSADVSRAFLILGPDGKPLSKEEHTSIYEELQDVLQKIMDNPETFHEAGAIELALGKRQKELVKGSQLSKGIASPSQSDSSLVSEENGVGYQNKESQCLTPHMCPVCWINDHMYCRNMKRIGSHLAPNAGCIHYMPCTHYKFLRSNPAEYTPGGTFITPATRALSDGTSVTIRGGRVLCKRMSPSSDVTPTKKPTSLPSCRKVRRPQATSKDGVDLLCHEELLESDSEPNSPPAEPGTELLRCQIKARAMHIARSLGIEDKELLHENIDLNNSFSPVKMTSVIVDDSCVTSQSEVDIEEYGAEVTIGDFSESEEEDHFPVPLSKSKSHDPWTVHPDHETHINIEINSSDKDKGTNIRLIPYADLKNTPQYIDIKGKKHRFIKIKVQKVDPRKFKGHSDSASLSATDKEKQTDALREFIAKSAEKVLREMNGEGQINLRMSDESGGFSIVNSQEDGDLSIKCEELSKDDLELRTSSAEGNLTEPKVLWSSQLDMLKPNVSPNAGTCPENPTTCEKPSVPEQLPENDVSQPIPADNANKMTSKSQPKVQIEILEESEDGEQKVVKIVTAVDQSDIAPSEVQEDPDKTSDPKPDSEHPTEHVNQPSSSSYQIIGKDLIQKDVADGERLSSSESEGGTEATWRLCEVTGKYVSCPPGSLPGGHQKETLSAASSTAVTALPSTPSLSSISPTVSPIAKFSVSSSVPPTVSEPPVREMLSGEPVRITSKITNLPEPLRKQVTPGEDGSQVLTFTTKDIREQRPELMAYIKKAKLVSVIKNTLLQEKTTLQKMIKDGEKSLKEAQLLLIKNEAAFSPEETLSSLKSEIGVVQSSIAATQQAMNASQAARARLKRRRSFFEAKAENLRKRLQMCIESLNRIIVMEEEEEEDEKPADATDVEPDTTEPEPMTQHFPPYVSAHPAKNPVEVMGSTTFEDKSVFPIYPKKMQSTGKTHLANYIQQKQQRQQQQQQQQQTPLDSYQGPTFSRPMLPGQSQKLLAVGPKQLLTYTVSPAVTKSQRVSPKPLVRSSVQSSLQPTGVVQSASHSSPMPVISTSEGLHTVESAVAGTNPPLPGTTGQQEEMVEISGPQVVSEMNEASGNVPGIPGQQEQLPGIPLQQNIPQSSPQQQLPASVTIQLDGNASSAPGNIGTPVILTQEGMGQVTVNPVAPGIMPMSQVMSAVPGVPVPQAGIPSVGTTPPVPIQQTGSIKFLQSQTDVTNNGQKLPKSADLSQITILSVTPPGHHLKQEQIKANQKLQDQQLQQQQQQQQQQQLLLPTVSVQPQILSTTTAPSMLNIPGQLPLNLYTLPPLQQQMAGGQKQILTYALPPGLQPKQQQQQQQQQQILQGQPQVLTYTAFPNPQPASPTGWKQPFPKPMKVVSLPVVQRNLPVQAPGVSANTALVTQSTQLLGVKSSPVAATTVPQPPKNVFTSTSSGLAVQGQTSSKAANLLPVSSETSPFVIPPVGIKTTQLSMPLDAQVLRKPIYVFPPQSVATASSHAPVTMTYVQPSAVVPQSVKTLPQPFVVGSTSSSNQPSVIVQPIADAYPRAVVRSEPCGVTQPGVHDHVHEGCMDPVACAKLAESLQTSMKSPEMVGVVASSGPNSVMTYTFVLGSQSTSPAINPMITKMPQLSVSTSPVYSSPLFSTQPANVNIPTQVTQTVKPSDSTNLRCSTVISQTPMVAQSVSQLRVAPSGNMDNSMVLNSMEVPMEIDGHRTSAFIQSPLLASSPVSPGGGALSVESQLLSDKIKPSSGTSSPCSVTPVISVHDKVGGISTLTVGDQLVVTDSRITCAQLVTDTSKPAQLSTYELLPAPQSAVLDDESNSTIGSVAASSIVSECSVPITSPISEWLVADTELNSTVTQATSVVLEHDASIPYPLSRPSSTPLPTNMLTPGMRRQLSLDSAGNSLMDESDAGLPSSQDTIGSDIYEELAFEEVSSSIL